MLMMGRRAALVSAVAAAGLIAGGCGSSKDDGGSGGTGNKALTISAWDTAGAPDPLDKAVADFKAANPGVRVTLNKTPYAQFNQSVRLALGSGRAPDVARLLVGYGESSQVRALADKGLVRDLSGSPWAKDIPKASAFTTNKDGKAYALPVASTTIGVVYDPAALAKAGVQVPTTFDQVLDVCKKVAGSGKVAFAMGAAGESGLPLFAAYALTASTVFADDPEHGAKRLAGEATFAGTPGWKQALDQFVQMKDAGCFDKNAIGVSQESASQQLKRGKALMAISLDLTMPLFTGGDPKSPLKMFPFPGSADAAKVRIPFVAASGLAVPSKAKNPELAQKFIDFYAERALAYSKVDGSIPAIPGKDGQTGLPAYAQALAPFVADGRTAPLPEALWPNPEVRTQLATGLVKLLIGKTQPDEVLAAMDKAWSPAAP
jgi:raffinose/stachyose/melibiose transport system substrate-binding protein